VLWGREGPRLLDEFQKSVDWHAGLQADAVAAAIDGERARVAFGGLEVMEGPAVDGGGVRGGEQRRRFARKQRDPEAVQRELKAVADGLDVGLLAGPATKEGGVALFGGKAEPVVAFSRGEEALDDGLLFVHVADEFDINAEFAMVGEGEDGELAGVGQVEHERAWGRSDARLAPFGVFEADLGGRQAEIAAQESAQSAPGEGEGDLQVVEAESGGALAFVGGEGVEAILLRRPAGGELCGPDVDFLGVEEDLREFHMPTLPPGGAGAVIWVLDRCGRWRARDEGNGPGRWLG